MSDLAVMVIVAHDVATPQFWKAGTQVLTFFSWEPFAFVIL